MVTVPFVFVDSAALAGDVDAQGMLWPRLATDKAAGFDLVAANLEPIDLQPFERALIPTGISLGLPEGFEGQVRPRSGLAIKHGITVLNAPGTIDADYRGEIRVILINLSNVPFRIERGMRVAQLVICKLADAHLDAALTLSETARGLSGFGSTDL